MIGNLRVNHLNVKFLQHKFKATILKGTQISCISNLLIFGSKPVKKKDYVYIMDYELHISSIKYLQLVSLFFAVTSSMPWNLFLSIGNQWWSNTLTRQTAERENYSIIELMSLFHLCFPVNNNLLLSHWVFHVTAHEKLSVL